MEIVSSISPMLAERLWRLEDSCQTKRRSLARAVQRRSPERENKRILPFLFHNPCFVPTILVSNHLNASMQSLFCFLPSLLLLLLSFSTSYLAIMYPFGAFWEGLVPFRSFSDIA